MSRMLWPSRERLHVAARLIFAGLANIALAIWAVPKLGHATDPVHSPVNAFWISLEILVPLAALLVLLPVFLFGKDVPRLLAIGLCVLPAFVAVMGIAAAISLCFPAR